MYLHHIKPIEQQKFPSPKKSTKERTKKSKKVTAEDGAKVEKPKKSKKKTKKSKKEKKLVLEDDGEFFFLLSFKEKWQHKTQQDFRGEWGSEQILENKFDGATTSCHILVREFHCSTPHSALGHRQHQ